MDEPATEARRKVRRLGSQQSRWLAAAALFAGGLGVGAIFWGEDAAKSAGPSDGAVAIGCADTITLVVEADNLPRETYELRASVAGDRMLPMINAMTYPILGKHRGHQSIVPDDDHVIVVANLPVGNLQAVRYQLVSETGHVAVGGTVPLRGCPTSQR